MEHRHHCYDLIPKRGKKIYATYPYVTTRSGSLIASISMILLNNNGKLKLFDVVTGSQLRVLGYSALDYQPVAIAEKVPEFNSRLYF